MSESTKGNGQPSAAGMSVTSWTRIGLAMILGANPARIFVNETLSYVLIAGGFVPIGIGVFLRYRANAALPEAERAAAMQRLKLRVPLLALVVVGATAIFVMFAASSPR